MLLSVLVLRLFEFLFSSTTPLATVDLGYAKYQGLYDDASHVTTFLGIRYAASPEGPLRWRAPRRPTRTNSVQAATRRPPACLQGILGASDHNLSMGKQAITSKRKSNNELEGASEDCLLLNVFTPGMTPNAVSPGPLLPVVVWIHGGGYAMGKGETSANDLIRASGEGAIVVAVQYRLGLFGFLSGQAVKDDGELNVGLLDQQFALKWVQEHIVKFGGDPKQVTIWGQSAGAGSVLQHIIANDGRTSPPLFKRAITGSTYLPSQYLYNDEIPEFWYNRVIREAGCTSLECLRRLDVTNLQRINIAVGAQALYGTLNFVPVVDGIFITQRPSEALRKGRVNGISLLATTVTDEGSPFVRRGVDDARQYLQDLFPRLSNNHTTAAGLLYAPLGDARSQAVAIMHESIFICPTYHLLRAFGGAIAYKGQFAIPPALHGYDVSYIFPESHGPREYNNTDFLHAYLGSVMTYVLAGDPNHTIGETITPRWEEHSITQKSMVFNRTENGEPWIHSVSAPPDIITRCAFWQSVSTETGQ